MYAEPGCPAGWARVVKIDAVQWLDLPNLSVTTAFRVAPPTCFWGVFGDAFAQISVFPCLAVETTSGTPTTVRDGTAVRASDDLLGRKSRYAKPGAPLQSAT